MDAVWAWTTISIARSSSGSSSGSNSSSPRVLVRRRLRRLEQRRVELLLPLAAALLDDERDLFLADVRALDALEAGRAERLEEHVALAEEALRPALVEDHARVGLARDRERDPRRDVRLDHAGDHVDRGALGREDEVDADGARLLRQPDDRVLDGLRRDHHQVGELVDHDEQVRQRRLAAARGRRGSPPAGCARAPCSAARSGAPSRRHVGEHRRRLLRARDDRRRAGAGSTRSS